MREGKPAKNRISSSFLFLMELILAITLFSVAAAASVCSQVKQDVPDFRVFGRPFQSGPGNPVRVRWHVPRTGIISFPARGIRIEIVNPENRRAAELLVDFVSPGRGPCVSDRILQEQFPVHA